MKKKLLVCVFVAISCITIAQPAVKLYGFKQESTPGTIPSGHRNENGTKSKKAAAATTYFTFLSSRKNAGIQPLWVIIDNKDFLITKIGWPEAAFLDSLAHSSSPIVLPPVIKGKIIELTIRKSGRKIRRRSPTLTAFAAANQMVAIYRWRARNYYVGVASMETLPPVNNE